MSCPPTDLFYVPLANLAVQPGDTVEILGRGTFVLLRLLCDGWQARRAADGDAEPEHLLLTCDARAVALRAR